MVFIEFSHQAIDDVDTIFQLILNDKPSVATEYVTKLENYIDLLKTNRYMGVECKKKAIKQNCRVLVYGNI